MAICCSDITRDGYLPSRTFGTHHQARVAGRPVKDRVWKISFLQLVWRINLRVLAVDTGPPREPDLSLPYNLRRCGIDHSSLARERSEPPNHCA